ncbi:MAG: hypothetical protein AAF714_08420 [Pseudomonadota bacterium]
MISKANKPDQLDFVGRFNALPRKPGINHLAELSDLSPSTITRAIEAKEPIRSKTQIKLLAGLTAYEVEVGLRSPRQEDASSTVVSLPAFHAPEDFSPSEADVIALLKLAVTRLDSLTDEYVLRKKTAPVAFVELIEKHTKAFEMFANQMKPVPAFK